MIKKKSNNNKHNDKIGSEKKDTHTNDNNDEEHCIRGDLPKRRCMFMCLRPCVLASRRCCGHV